MSYYHLTYYRDWFDIQLPIREMEVCIGIYDSEALPIAEAAAMNAACAPNERFCVYASLGKKLSKRSKKIFDGTECDYQLKRNPPTVLYGYPLTNGRARNLHRQVSSDIRALWPYRHKIGVARRIQAGIKILRCLKSGGCFL